MVFYKAARSSLAETAMFVTLGLVGLFAVIIAFLAGSAPASPKTRLSGNLQRVPVVRYLRSGQLVADARTAGAMIQYLLDFQPAMPTNPGATGPTPLNSPLPTSRKS
jgi:hypothetical protein